MKLLVILSHPPYDGTDVIWNAIRLIDTALVEKHNVFVFVMNDAVDTVRKDSKPESAEFDLGEMLIESIKRGAHVKICTTCVNRCGISKGEIIPEAKLSGMSDLVKWIAEADKIVTF
jgi:uncharacterized protein involved in oxidation of intracellular sulfur